MHYITLYLIFAMCATVWYDMTRYTIPNWLVTSLLVLYFVALYLTPYVIDWKMALAGFSLVFIAGFIIFSAGVMGGGDIKLISVLALWVGWQELPTFIIGFGILGGIFTLILLLVRFLVRSLKNKPKILQKNAPIPYGVAIAGAFLWMMWQGKIPMASASVLRNLA